ncbi:unnamed protein product [Urochloa humidicola]
MAEAVVGVLTAKLSAALAKEAVIYGASLLAKEASALKGLFGEIRKAEAELEIMKAYLRDSEKFKDVNEATGIFVWRIRDLAFRIEDVVDEFTYRQEECKHGGLATKLKKRIKHTMIWRRLALELRNINAELEDAARKRERYVMPGVLERYAGGSGHHAGSSKQTLSFAREEDLVGIEDNVVKLAQWLVGDLEGRSNKIATVWGMGGVGKTTLVDHVYKIVKADFDTAAWVTVSKSYQVEDLLTRIAREFGVSIDARNMETRSLVEVIRIYLEGKRYILILDDVWEKDVWINIMDVFPSNGISRIVLTSRKHEVASLATNGREIKLEPLGEDHSWDLFCKLAFRNSDDKRFPSELQYLAVKFLQKCEGLPIAIACIGRLLSCKPTTYSAWKNVYEDLELQSSENVIPGVDVILKVSLDDLPFELKNCFLHCAIFPEDYEMKRRRLIRHWVTAGFIKEKENQTMEEVAEGCLNELVNRSLLQVVKKNGFGRVKCCRMHDAVRHLALDRAEKECFGKVYEGCRTFSVDGTRRLSIQSSNIGPLSQSGATSFRAIHVFTSYIDTDLLRSILASSNLLSTLDLQGTQLKMLPDEVFSLFNLQFLGLRNTGIKVLPEKVGRLQNLVVLDALGTCLLDLPKNVAKLKKLRFLYACAVLIERNLRRYDGVKVPRGIRNLTRLHALQNVKASLETLCDVAALTELRTFAVCNVNREHSINLCSAILNMRHLVHLSITASTENDVLPMEALRLPETLSILELEGQLEKERMPQILSSWSHLHNLTRLSLISSKLEEDSFSCFVLLRNLCFLDLSKAYDGKKLDFCALSFPRVRQLRVCDAPQLKQVKIEEGALENLVELVFSDCPELNSLPDGIEYLTTLEELRLLDTADELIEMLRKECRANQFSEELMKISHIRKVFVRLTEKNIWEKIL